jgi:hypothetical protein
LAFTERNLHGASCMIRRIECLFPHRPGAIPMSLARFCTTIAALVLISFAIQPGQAANASAAPEAASLTQPLR